MVIYHCNLNFDDDENDDDDDDDNIWQYDDDDDFGLILILILMMVHASSYNPLVSAICDSKGGFTPKLAEAYTNHLKDETSSQQGCCCLLARYSTSRMHVDVVVHNGQEMSWLTWKLSKNASPCFLQFGKPIQTNKGYTIWRTPQSRDAETLVIRTIGHHERWLVVCTQDKGMEVIFISSDRCLVWALLMAMLEMHKGELPQLFQWIKQI